ncbi:MAG: HD domain-containing protein [Treponema sp.]|nr:HD domain-containing protein [Treponema sp.]
MISRRMNLKSIIKIDTELIQVQDLDLLLERILLEARSVLHADAGTIYVKEIVDEKGVMVDKLTMKYSQNDTKQKELPPGQKLIYSVFSVPLNEKTISGYCAITQQLVNVSDAYHLTPGVPYSFGINYDQISGYKTTSILTVPLKTAEGRLLGVIQVINAKDRAGRTIPFTKNDEFLISHFAVNATMALQKAQLIRTMILRMIKMAELRDPKETGAHVNRVAGYAVEIYDRWASKHNITDVQKDRFKDDFKIATMLHDAGKVAISDIILKKPAKFTPEEYLIMQNHTIYGATLFEDTQSRLDLLSREIAFTHHENWDGTGYPGWVDPVSGETVKAGAEGRPLGKKGDEIPLTGRIVSIADVFDALCSKRVYKDPWTEEDVLIEIRKLAGTKFDPELVDIFFEILPSIKQIQNLYPEAIN